MTPFGQLENVIPNNKEEKTVGQGKRVLKDA